MADFPPAFAWRMGILHRLTANSRMARENNIRITVTYYVPCEDPNSESYGLRGQYHIMTGICRKVDPTVSRCLLIDERKIRFRDIYRIENEDGIFDEMTEA